MWLKFPWNSSGGTLHWKEAFSFKAELAITMVICYRDYWYKPRLWDFLAFHQQNYKQACTPPIKTMKKRENKI